MLGTTTQDEDMVRLNKSSIAIAHTDNKQQVSYPSTLFTCAQILSLIETTALKRFVVHSPEQDENHEKLNPLLLWVFNPDIYYSCSAFEGNSKLSRAVIGDASQQMILSSDSSARGVTEHDQSTPDQESLSHQNPNGDDTSQIYGAPSQGQKIEAELHFDLPSHVGRSSTSGKTASSIPSILETETQFPQHVAANSETSRHNVTHPPSDSQNDHVNLVHRAAKVFYRILPEDTDVAGYLDQNSATHEELFLTDPADHKSLQGTLEKSTTMLPASARKFQDWDVGLLDRFEKNPSGLGVMQENPLARGIQSRDGRVTRWDVGHGAEGLYA